MWQARPVPLASPSPDHAPTAGGPGPVPALVVGAAVVDDLDRPRYLLSGRRTEPPHLAGGWELPGGKVEPGEDPRAALHRELGEELGVEVDLGAEIVGPAGGWRLPPLYRMRVWLARVTAGEPAPIEAHDALRWLGPGQWLDVGWLPANLPVVRAVMARSPGAVPRPGCP